MVDSPEPRLLGFKTSFHEMLTVSQPPKAFDYQRDKLLERGSASWIYSGPLPNDEKNDDDLPNFIGNIPGSLANGYLWGYHGTAAAGKVVGSGYGLAPFADLFIVKIQTGRNSVSTELGLLDTLIKVYDDIKRSIDEDTDRSIKGAVISISSLFDLHVDEEDNKEWWDAVIGLYRDILEHFEHINPKVYLVVPAGNEDPGTPIIAYPTSLILNERAEKPGALKQCFVVGGVDRNGGRLFQEDPNVDFYAPAEELAIPLPPIDPKRPHLLDGIQLQEGGTSNATPLVAGLLAMLIGQGEIDPAVQMKAWAYPRKRGGHDVIWNGIREEMWAKAGGEYEPKDRKRPRPQDDPTEDV
ncbi:uncharacterized protein DFL_008748 [Arthrobotrys flagrans]|uniref:Peptidase S8/S53 domain-containing protein n=1 Tax=Arthrobotrys flagrans TaxID=97331 RepID=A0A436ZPN4_ARTFL|nr:hypothetical protein DFL_008748 [Arthrobotrys flagrans]